MDNTNTTVNTNTTATVNNVTFANISDFAKALTKRKITFKVKAFNACFTSEKMAKIFSNTVEWYRTNLVKNIQGNGSFDFVSQVNKFLSLEKIPVTFTKSDYNFIKSAMVTFRFDKAAGNYNGNATSNTTFLKMFLFILGLKLENIPLTVKSVSKFKQTEKDMFGYVNGDKETAIQKVKPTEAASTEPSESTETKGIIVGDNLIEKPSENSSPITLDEKTA
jgi:hypothetical protein